MNKCQIKTQILKLAKILNQFSVDDILIMLDLEKQDAQEILSELEKDFLIKKIGESRYLYFKQNNFKQDVRSETQPIVCLFDNEEEIEIYEKSTTTIKRNIYKYIFLIKKTKGLVGKELTSCLSEIGKEYPQYSVSYGTFKRHQRQYLLGGLKALIPQYCKNNSFHKTDPEIYEYFKKLYLHPRKFSIVQCEKIIREDKRFLEAQMPSGAHLKRQLLKEYTKEKIKEMRNVDFALPELIKDPIKIENKKKPRNKLFVDYIDAIDFYFSSVEFTQKSAKRRTMIKSLCKNHLNPFFKNLKFIEITQEKINEFQKLKNKEGLSLSSISIYLSFLGFIVNSYSKEEKQFILRGRNKLGDFCYGKILTNEQVSSLLKTNSSIKLILMFIFSLGTNEAALLALDYEDIDFKEKTIKINKLLYKNNIEKYNCAYQRRFLKIPATLFNEIPKIKSGRIFNISSDSLDKEIAKLGLALNIKDLTYEDFIDTHVKILIDNKIQVNLISSNLGFGDIRDFLKKYKNIIPEATPELFDPLDLIQCTL